MIVQTLEGAKFKMRASCQKGHERISMYEDHIRKRYFCIQCGETVSPEVIWLNVPEEFRPPKDPLAATLQGLLDFEVEAVVMEDGDLLIEYPKRKV